ncbi:hypothetical protein [Phaeobacter italicus]|uniref:hypothetical protein n=1 Tax=Phaeobacter italicus TaxID=481446 RepID=UPI001FFE0559|nr:hypothetical protein [Phaeobacter italicus]
MHQKENERGAEVAGLRADHARPQEKWIRSRWMTPEVGRTCHDRNDMSLRKLIWRGMIKLRPIADNDPVLDQSRLLQAMELAFAYADTHGGIGLTQTKAFNRKFTHWMAEHSPWPDYKAEELLRLSKVLNEWDVAPAMVVHDLMILMKLGRHVKGKF